MENCTLVHKQIAVGSYFQAEDYSGERSRTSCSRRNLQMGSDAVNSSYFNQFTNKQKQETLSRLLLYFD